MPMTAYGKPRKTRANQVRMTEEEHQRLSQMAYDRGLSMSQLLIDSALGSHRMTTYVTNQIITEVSE